MCSAVWKCFGGAGNTFELGYTVVNFVRLLSAFTLVHSEETTVTTIIHAGCKLRDVECDLLCFLGPSPKLHGFFFLSLTKFKNIFLKEALCASFRFSY